MTQEQDEMITMIEDSARRFLDDLSESETHSADNLWSSFTEMGWLGLALPEALGGAGLGVAEVCALTRLFGRFALPNAYISQCVLPSFVLTNTGDDASASAASIGESIASGDKRVSVAWQEKAGDLNHQPTGCAISAGKLNGSKYFVAGARVANVFLVSCSMNGENTIAAVDATASGVSVEQSIDSELNFANVKFDDVVINDDAILLRGNAATVALNTALQAATIALAAELEGGAGGCLDQTLEHIKTRKQFKQPIGSFQAIRHRSVDLLIELRLAESSWRRAVAELQGSSASELFLPQAHVAKARCGDAALKIAKEAIQMHGAMGFTEEAGVGRYMRQAMSLSAWLGSARHHRNAFMQETANAKNDNVAAPTNQTTATHSVEGVDLDALPDEEFRLRFRAWLTEHYPEEWKQSHRRPFLRLHGKPMRAWLRKLNEHGWRAPEWPKEYGGLGLSFRKQLIYKEEFNRMGGARIVDNGETQLGPTLMKFGTDKQKEYFLPRILNSDDHWAQGYSEPNAGSDLASLSTKADLQGDKFIVNGQKIWTTFAQECSFIYMLVRTGQFEKKQQGISFLLVDLTAPGVTIRPILNIAGETELCEVFFDDVEVPAENLVGELHEGWTIAKSLLGHERIWIGDPSMAMRAHALAEQLVVETGQQDDPVVMNELAALTADLHDYRSLYADICDHAAETNEIGPEASMLKVYASELLQRTTEFNLRIAGEYGVASGDSAIGNTNVNLHWQVMMARPTTIYAGCNEVQRDILAMGMGLPRK